MYNFRTLDVVSNDDDKFIPSEAMYFVDSQTPIESIVDGYVTLQTSGRELVTPDVDLREYDYYDGGEVVHRRFPTRKIVITYAMFAKNSYEFRQSFNYLNELLFSQETFKFYFRDDPDYYWEGIVSEMDDFPSGTNEGKATFTITCLDSFKRSQTPLEITGSGTFEITDDIIYPTRPERIVFHYTDQVFNTYIKDAHNREILLTGTFANGDELEVRMDDPDKKFVYFSDYPTPERLQVISDFQTFSFVKGDSITVNANCNVTMETRRKLL